MLLRLIGLFQALEQENEARRIAENKNVLLLANEVRLVDEQGRLQAAVMIHEGRSDTINAELNTYRNASRERTESSECTVHCGALTL